MDEILNKDIKIAKIEVLDNRLKITDDEDTWFKVWYTKKDGTNTQAYSQYKDMGLKPGSTVNVSYKEEAKEYQGKPYKDRTVLGFKETNGTGMSTPGYNGHDTKKTEQDAFGRRLALHGFVNSRLVNNSISTVKAELVELLGLEDEIEAWLNGKSNSLTSPQNFDDGIETIRAEDIPF